MRHMAMLSADGTHDACGHGVVVDSWASDFTGLPSVAAPHTLHVRALYTAGFTAQKLVSLFSSRPLMLLHACSVSSWHNDRMQAICCVTGVLYTSTNALSLYIYIHVYIFVYTYVYIIVYMYSNS